MEPKGSLPHSQVVEIIYTYFQFWSFVEVYANVLKISDV